MWSLDTKIETEEEFQTLDHHDLSQRRILQDNLRKKREYLKNLRPPNIQTSQIQNLITKFWDL
jgi:hypothetical protein